jgi:glycosyltransferase involved in cell wall biosynthesis
MISAIVITKDEEKMIEDCLKSLDFCEEIIVLDSGSNDKTVEICKKYTDRIYQNKFSDFASTRNEAAKHAAGIWILYIDADERISSKLKMKIAEVIKDEEYSGYEIKRNNNFLGVWMKRGGWEDEYLLRLMRKDKLKKWFGHLHETAEVEGKIGKIEEPILHFSHRDLSSMVEKTIKWSDLEAEERIKNKHPLMTIPRFVKIFFKELFIRLVIKKAWKDGVVGIIEAIYQSYSLLITYLKLWEKQIK